MLSDFKRKKQFFFHSNQQVKRLKKKQKHVTGNQN